MVLLRRAPRGLDHACRGPQHTHSRTLREREGISRRSEAPEARALVATRVDVLPHARGSREGKTLRVCNSAQGGGGRGAERQGCRPEGSGDCILARKRGGAREGRRVGRGRTCLPAAAEAEAARAAQRAARAATNAAVPRASMVRGCRGAGGHWTALASGINNEAQLDRHSH